MANLLIFNFISIIAFSFVLSACEETNSISNTTTKAPIPEESSQAVSSPQISTPVIECAGLKPVSDLIMDVIGDEHLLYTLPNDKAPAVINKKASEIFHTKEYHHISTSARVKVHCEKGDWVFVQLTMPEWLTYVKGWTKREYLKPLYAKSGEPTKALDSNLSLNDIPSITTSDNLTKADLAWHAINTYGFDCSEVISKGQMTTDGYFLISCSSGLELRVYLRNNQHPNITNN